MDLVVHQVRQLQHVDVAHSHWLFEPVASHAIMEIRFSRRGQAGPLEQRLDLGLARAIEHWRRHEHALGQTLGRRLQPVAIQLGNRLSHRRILEESFEFTLDGFLPRVLSQQLRDLLAQFVPRPAQMGFQNLANVHTAGYAERVENDLHWRPVVEIRHVLVWQDSGNHAFIAVTAGHLIANAELTLHGDINLDQLDHAGRKLVPLGELLLLLINDLLQHIDLTRGHFLDLIDLLVHPRILIGKLDSLQVAGGDALDRVTIKKPTFS